MDRLRILGQEVRVYKNGIVWVEPETRKRFMIGKTRAEAEAELRSWKERRFGAFSSAAARALPAMKDGTKINRIYWRALYNARTRARRAGVQVMTATEYAAIVARAGGRCEVSGIPFSDAKQPGQKKAIWAPSIDRIECSSGYEASNCRLVCIAVNIALNEFGIETLTRIANAIEAKSLRAPT